MYNASQEQSHEQEFPNTGDEVVVPHRKHFETSIRVDVGYLKSVQA